MTWPTSFDSSQWRRFLTPAVMVFTSRESKTLMLSVASLLEELFRLEQEVSILCFKGTVSDMGVHTAEAGWLYLTLLSPPVSTACLLWPVLYLSP